MAFVPYYEKFTTNGLVGPDLPFTGRIVLVLCYMLFSNVNGTGYHIFTDRFCTSPIFREKLMKMSFHLTGTVKPSRKVVPTDFVKKENKLKVHDVEAFRKLTT